MESILIKKEVITVIFFDSVESLAFENYFSFIRLLFVTIVSKSLLMMILFLK